MIYGKMWYVVKPSIGVPLFFVAVASASLIVHIGILTHTDWYPAFLEGHQKAKPAAVGMLTPTAPAGAVTYSVLKS